MFYTDLTELIYFLSCLHITPHGYLIVVISNKNFPIKTGCRCVVRIKFLKEL